MASRAALFDMDGTLADTNHLHVVAWWEAFRQAGHRVTTSAIHHAVGLPGTELVARVLGEDRDKDTDESIDFAHKTLYATYFDRLAPLPGAGELLRALAGQGWRVIVVTSAADAELAALRRAVHADDAITDFTSAESVRSGKPAPDQVERALSQADVPPERAVFVGDSVWDMLAAVRAGVHPVGMLSGGLPRADLVENGAREVYRDPAELLSALETSVFAQVADR